MPMEAEAVERNLCSQDNGREDWRNKIAASGFRKIGMWKEAWLYFFISRKNMAKIYSWKLQGKKNFFAVL